MHNLSEVIYQGKMDNDRRALLPKQNITLQEWILPEMRNNVYANEQLRNQRNCKQNFLFLLSYYNLLLLI